MRICKAFCILVFLALGFHTANASNPANGGGGKESENIDTVANLKSNFIIFKMITNPVPATNGINSLKRAGKVARTSSNSHSANKIDTSRSRTQS